MSDNKGITYVSFRSISDTHKQMKTEISKMLYDLIRDKYIPNVENDAIEYKNLSKLTVRLQKIVYKKSYSSSDVRTLFVIYKNQSSTIFCEINNELNKLIKNLEKKLLPINNTNWGSYINRSVNDFIKFIHNVQGYFDKHYGNEPQKIYFDTKLSYLVDVYKDYPVLGEIIYYYFDKLSDFINTYLIQIPDELDQIIYGFIYPSDRELWIEEPSNIDNYTFNENLDFIKFDSSTKKDANNIKSKSVKEIPKAEDLEKTTKNKYKFESDINSKIQKLYSLYMKYNNSKEHESPTLHEFGLMFENADFSKFTKEDGTPNIVSFVIYCFHTYIYKGMDRKEWYQSACNSINKTIVSTRTTANKYAKRNFDKSENWEDYT